MNIVGTFGTFLRLSLLVRDEVVTVVIVEIVVIIIVCIWIRHFDIGKKLTYRKCLFMQAYWGLSLIKRVSTVFHTYQTQSIMPSKSTSDGGFRAKEQVPLTA